MSSRSNDDDDDRRYDRSRAAASSSTRYSSNSTRVPLRNASDHVSSSSRLLRRTSGRIRGEEDDVEKASGDELVLGFEHRMNTDERRRMREREADRQEHPRQTRASEIEPAITYGRASRRASLTEQYRIPGASSNVAGLETHASSKRTAYSRAMEKQDRGRRQAEVDRILKTSRDRRGSLGDDQKGRSTVSSAEAGGMLNVERSTVADAARVAAMDSEPNSRVLARGNAADPNASQPQEKTSRRERTRDGADKGDRILKKKERLSRGEPLPTRSSRDHDERKESSKHSSRSDRRSGREDQQTMDRSSRMPSRKQEEDAITEHSERRKSSRLHDEDERMELSERSRSQGKHGGGETVERSERSKSSRSQEVDEIIERSEHRKTSRRNKDGSRKSEDHERRSGPSLSKEERVERRRAKESARRLPSDQESQRAPGEPRHHRSADEIVLKKQDRTSNYRKASLDGEKESAEDGFTLKQRKSRSRSRDSSTSSGRRGRTASQRSRMLRRGRVEKREGSKFASSTDDTNSGSRVPSVESSDMQLDSSTSSGHVATGGGSELPSSKSLDSPSRPRKTRIRDEGELGRQSKVTAADRGPSEKKISQHRPKSKKRSSDKHEARSGQTFEAIAGSDRQSSDDAGESWTLRVSLVSAADLPLSMLPNVPLCPVVKCGLVMLPSNESGAGDLQTQGIKSRRLMQERIEKEGLASIPHTRVRCSNGRILTKRDNGAVDFNEEIRWDKVYQPEGTALAVELCARAILPPTNIDESPLAGEDSSSALMRSSVVGSVPRSDMHRVYSLPSAGTRLKNQQSSGDRNSTWEKEPTNSAGAARSLGLLGLDDIAKGGVSTKSLESADASTGSHGDDSQASGISGMRALWRKGRQQFEQRQAAKRSSDSEFEVSSSTSNIARLMDEDNSSALASEGNSAGSESVAGGRELQIAASGNGVSTLSSHGGGAAGGENFALVRPRKKRRLEMTKDVHIGSIVIPLTRLPLAKAFVENEAARLEQWYQFDCDSRSPVQAPSTPSWRGNAVGKPPPHRNPSVLLEISFSSPDLLDESEDEMDEISDGEHGPNEGHNFNDSHKRRSSDEEKAKSEQVTRPDLAESKKQPDDPVLQPGVVDFIAVVGARSIGDQKDDDGTIGWVNTTPECCVLEQFPPNDEFHIQNGRNASLMDKVEWFCFPDGWKIWRGSEPPTHSDLNLKRFSASSQATVAANIPAFDACLDCTTSFSWYVISSNSDDYGSRTMKSYGAVIRFYAPAPPGIDLTQDDYAQHGLDKADTRIKGKSSGKRLWVPMGIVMTTTFPIIGVLEAMLLRICESLVARTGSGLQTLHAASIQSLIQQDLANLIINFQKPIPGVLHCSIPFLAGERLHLTRAPPTGLPSLPHGSAVTAACRLLGSEGLNLLLAAVLTECKILLHSHEVANLGMVAEVVSALIYPFSWALPYIPVLPDAMVEFIEAPLSYLLGVPTSSMKLIDSSVLSDVVVVDLDNGFSSPDYFEGRRGGKSTKIPTPLPSQVASNISKAVFRLLREEEEVEEEYGASNFPGTRSLPQLEAESLAEREFRIAIALQVCSLVRGYDDCLFKVSASQPVFNRDKFLRTAPALFDTPRGNASMNASNHGQTTAQRTLSPRSKRFLSLFVNCQHFHQFLESLDDDECAFFNEVMFTFDMKDQKREEPVANSLIGNFGTSRLEEATAYLSNVLQKVEDKIPTYRVERKAKNGIEPVAVDGDDTNALVESLLQGQGRQRDVGFVDDGSLTPKFTSVILQQVVDPTVNQAQSSRGDDELSTISNQSEGVRSLSVQYLMELEKNNWRYTPLLVMSGDQAEGEGGESPRFVKIWDKVKLKEAIGERRYRAWKLAQDQKNSSDDSANRVLSGDLMANDGNASLDLTSLLTSATDEMTSDASSATQSITSLSSHVSKRNSSLSTEQRRIADAKDMDVLRRCLELAYDEPQHRQTRPGLQSLPSGTFLESGRDLIAEAEVALRNTSAQHFLLSILSQRSRLEHQRKRRQSNEDSSKGTRRHGNQQSLSRLEPIAFDCLVRLSCAMLDACLEYEDYAPAYDLLKQTAGFFTVLSKEGRPMSSRDLELSQEHGSQAIYMTSRIGLHPIFANLSLWGDVLSAHLKERENDKSPVANSESDPGRSTPVEIGKLNDSASNVAEYEAAVATLYDMLGFGIPAEELARFATRVSEQRGWFSSERGQSLLMLVKRISGRREHGDDSAAVAGDLSMLNKRRKSQSISSAQSRKLHGSAGIDGEDVDYGYPVKWEKIGWCHPAAQPVSRMSSRESSADDAKSRRLKRSPVTSLASFGPSIIASGGLDGGVFIAHSIEFGRDDDRGGKSNPAVRGFRLDWGSSTSRSSGISSVASAMNGEYGVGAVSCLAAAKGAGFRHSILAGGTSANGDVSGFSTEDDVLSAMEGCRVAAGTTAGDLRVWSVKDVYAATVLAPKSDEASLSDATAALGQLRLNHTGGGGASSAFVSRPKRGSITEIAAGNAFSRLKFSLRGRALSGHRGGVTCIDVPSHIYRPDSLVTGGADGFIKLWSLRQPASGRRTSGDTLGGSGSNLFNTSTIVASSGNDRGGPARTKTGRGGDALSILSGHAGRILCVKTAWHGDRLLSGGSDRTLRIWDLAGGSGKCINSLSGHLGWVTHAHYWGPNTIVSASTDRSVALWDARVRHAPLFVLRHHHSPVSDMLVGSRTDPLMVSAAGDGTIATWDFRTLSTSEDEESPDMTSPIHQRRQCTSVRNPAATMSHCAEGKGVQQSGPVLLSRGVTNDRQTVLSVGVDAAIREWDIASGRLLTCEATGHCDAISSFSTFSSAQNSLSVSGVEPFTETEPSFGGMITSSWDGTVRFRRFTRE